MRREASAEERLARALGFDDPAVVLKALDALYADVDAAVHRGQTGLELPCRAGCDACCHEAVFVSAPEFLAVAAYMSRTMTEDECRRIVAEMTAFADTFEDELLLLEALSAGAERDEVAERIRFRCPLLSAQGRCSVYPVRELNARTFGASRDEQKGQPYGCELTHARLRILPKTASAGLMSAREARRWLKDRVPGAGPVRVYPWWFAQYGPLLFED
ncbi:MAG: YkgJ family cysteine cluster protein [Myxococcota bacterium]